MHREFVGFGICLVIRRSSMTMKAHTYYIIFGRPPIEEKLPPSPLLAAPLHIGLHNILILILIILITLDFACTSLPLAGHWVYPGRPSALGFLVTDRSRHSACMTNDILSTSNSLLLWLLRYGTSNLQQTSKTINRKESFFRFLPTHSLKSH